MTHMLQGEPAQTGIYLHNTENPHKLAHYAVKQVNKMSNKVHSKVKYNSLYSEMAKFLKLHLEMEWVDLWLLLHI